MLGLGQRASSEPEPAYSSEPIRPDRNVHQTPAGTARAPRDRNVHQTPAGTVGALERGFSEITNATGLRGWVVGVYSEQSKALAGAASMIADAQTAKYGRDPTDQQRPDQP